MYLPTCCLCIASIAPIVLHFWADVQSQFSMDSISSTLLWFLCTDTFIPGGKKGVLLKSNDPLIAVCADIVGFRQQGLKIFKLIVACGMSQHQRCMGN